MNCSLQSVSRIGASGFFYIHPASEKFPQHTCHLNYISRILGIFEKRYGRLMQQLNRYVQLGSSRWHTLYPAFRI